MKTSLLHTSFLGLALCGLFTLSTQAAPLVDYIFDPVEPGSDTHTLAPVTGTVADDFSAGAMFDEVSTGSNSGFSSFSDSYFIRANLTPGTQGEALTDGIYMDFTVQADAGFNLTLEDMDFRLGATAGSPASYNVNAALYTSTDGFASNSVLVDSFSSTFSNQGTTPVYDDKNADLSAYENLTGPLTLRFYFWDNNSDGANHILRLEELTLNGTINAVPEPTGAALLFGGVSLLFLRRRRTVRQAIA